jgi:cell division septal protein FtsQ
MDIKTNRSREVQKDRIIPPPDKARRRKKSIQNISNGHLGGWRFLPAMKTLGKFCAFLLIVLFMLFIFRGVYKSDKFNLQDIKFYGCKELDPGQLEEFVRCEFPVNVLHIDLPQLKEKLEKEPWVRQVEIQRILPSRMVIYVQERVPSVILELHGDLMVADQDGQMLDQYDPRFGKLDVPVLRGVLGENREEYHQHQDENAARIRNALAVLSEIESELPEDARKISEVDISDQENLKLMLVNDTAEVNLGSKDHLKRFRALMDSMDQYQELKNENKDIALIDLRLDGRIRYQLRNAGQSIQR